MHRLLRLKRHLSKATTVWFVAAHFFHSSLRVNSLFAVHTTISTTKSPTTTATDFQEQSVANINCVGNAPWTWDGGRVRGDWAIIVCFEASQKQIWEQSKRYLKNKKINSIYYGKKAKIFRLKASHWHEWGLDYLDQATMYTAVYPSSEWVNSFLAKGSATRLFLLWC